MDARDISHHIESDPGHPGPAHARLRDSGVPVWTLIAYLRAVDGNTRQAAKDYDISEGAVEAALAYYTLFRDQIEARIILNAAPVA